MRMGVGAPLRLKDQVNDAGMVDLRVLGAERRGCKGHALN